jgi:hypothetical protein
MRNHTYVDGRDGWAAWCERKIKSVDVARLESQGIEEAKGVGVYKAAAAGAQAGMPMAHEGGRSMGSVAAATASA